MFHSYPNNIECEWTIEASSGNQMGITIEMLDIDQSDQCNDDYLEIREQSSEGKLLGEWLLVGSVRFSSTSSRLIFTFHRRFLWQKSTADSATSQFILAEIPQQQRWRRIGFQTRI